MSSGKIDQWRGLKAGAFGILALSFAFGGAVNIIGPPYVTEGFARWGYPSWFHSVNGALLLVTSLMLWVDRLRLFGLALGMAISIAAICTLIWNGEYTHCIPALIQIAVLSSLTYFSRGRLKRWNPPISRGNKLREDIDASA